MKSLGIVIGDTGVSSEGISLLLSSIYSLGIKIDVSIFSDQIIGNAPCPKFCMSELVSFSGDVITFTVGDVKRVMSLHKKIRPIFIFDKQQRGNLIEFMQLLDSIDLSIINQESIIECYRLTGIQPTHLLETIQNKIGDN